jgi:hypothetical protein
MRRVWLRRVLGGRDWKKSEVNLIVVGPLLVLALLWTPWHGGVIGLRSCHHFAAMGAKPSRGP